MKQISNTKRKYFDLEQRTRLFACKVNELILKLVHNAVNTEIAKQLVRSAGSVGANYIEANEALSKRDFVMRVKISKKEAKESRYWLSLLNLPENLEYTRGVLIQEATEIMKILGAILNKCQS